MVKISKKSYLSSQIKMMAIATYDLFTDKEYQTYQEIITTINDIQRAKNDEAKEHKSDPSIVPELISKKQMLQEQLQQLIAEHKGIPRTVRMKNVLNPVMLKREQNEILWPEGVTWMTIKPSRKVTEFMSQASRAMGLKHDDVTFDKIVVKWKSQDILEQIILDGFNLPVIKDNGQIETKHFIFLTASAGQLRTDKITCIEQNAWKKIKERLMCGLSEESINDHSGINLSKYMAYLALPNSATDYWESFDIDRCIVVEDFENTVKGNVKYIYPDYTYKTGQMEVSINHIDGSGTMLPSVMGYTNVMVRAPWIKGLLSAFDFIQFCRQNNCQPVIDDIYGKRHDLIEQNIQIIFSKSQFKLWKYYKDWDEYKECFKRCHCTANRTNFEQDWIGQTSLNYQMEQTLCLTDEDIAEFTRKTHEKIVGMTRDKQTMLHTLNAQEDSQNPYQKSLFMYPELLRDGYSKENLKAIKKRWMLDARSGAIKCKNKRLFVIPDLYAACEYWFLHIEKPNGLLCGDEIAVPRERNHYVMVDRQEFIKAGFNPGRNNNEYIPVVDVLRSPHLSMEHQLQTIVSDEEVYKWFRTGGIYTSTKSLISRRLQFDTDGDQLNFVYEPVIVMAAMRDCIEHHVLTLYYDANKAPAQTLNRQALYHGVCLAHKNSGIGQISNNLTKLWSRQNPDRQAADLLCFFNNQMIDGAKTGAVNSYEDYPEAKAKINKAIGGKRGRMPYFFQFSKNGRAEKNNKKGYAKQNNSTMNRICRSFDDIGRLDMNYAGVDPFNYEMMLSEAPGEYDIDAVKTFCDLDNNAKSLRIAATNEQDSFDREIARGYDFIREIIEYKLLETHDSIEEVYPSIVKYLYSGDNFNKSTHKQMFWRMFGDIAQRNIEENLQTCSVCSRCGAKYPAWKQNHVCLSNAKGFFNCKDCGRYCIRTHSKQCRCVDCQREYRKKANAICSAQYRQKKKG